MSLRGGTDLQRFDFLVSKITLFYILHHQHASYVAATQNWHTYKAQKRVFAGLRAIGKARMRWRIGQIERSFVLRNIAD